VLLVETLHYKLITNGVMRISHWHHPSGCTMALGSTQPLREMCTGSISSGLKTADAYNWQPYHHVLTQEILELQPPGTLRACPGLYRNCLILLYLFTRYYCCARKRYVVKHNLITEVYLMAVLETTTYFGLYWPSSGCLGNLRASYMHAHARGVEISTYA